MADWALPTLTSTYANFLDYLAARDLDVAKMFVALPTNPVADMMRYDRTGNKFQEYLAGVWTDKLLSLAGGGTGANTAANARTNLGIGTLGVQDFNNVTITGGVISGLGSLQSNGVISGPGSGITAINAANIATGLVNPLRLGTGTPNNTKFLRGDGLWIKPAMVKTVAKATGTMTPVGTTTYNFTVTPTLTDYTKAVIVYASAGLLANLISNTQVAVGPHSVSNASDIVIHIVEFDY